MINVLHFIGGQYISMQTSIVFVFIGILVFMWPFLFILDVSLFTSAFVVILSERVILFLR